MKLDALKNKSIVILGLGREGISTLAFLRKLFPEIKLGVADQLPFDSLSEKTKKLLSSDSQLFLHLGNSYLTACSNYDVVIKSPGISPYTPEFQILFKENLMITSQTALFFDNFTGRTIGVTGTKGKSTTSSLIYHLLKTAGKNVQLGGNIGIPPLELLQQKSAWAVLELSSHQLWNLRVSPTIGVLLNIYKEHLDYSTFAEYEIAKLNIARFQTERDFFVFNAADQNAAEFVELVKSHKYSFGKRSEFPGCYIEKSSLKFKSDSTEAISNITDIPLKGPANLINIQAAVTVAKITGVTNSDVSQALKSFTPLPGRLETIGTYKGITFVDDYLSTIPQATLNALYTFKDSVGALFLGGFERQQDYAKVVAEINRQRIPLVILFPTTGTRIAKQLQESRFSGNFILATSMQSAVTQVLKHCPRGKIALFSTGAPSFGLFKNYQDRSLQFRTWLTKLGS